MNLFKTSEGMKQMTNEEIITYSCALMEGVNLLEISTWDYLRK